MDEQFLHYIWKYQKFNPGQLTLTDGQHLIVFYQGNHNHDSGPDFEEARIKIGDIEWAGHVEIHVRSSDWLQHNHQKDPAYENVILHVVWEHDKEILISRETIPTLELRTLVDPTLLEKYKQHIHTTEEILCSNQIKGIASLKVSSMLDRVTVERLDEKASRILSELGGNTNDWEEITYRTLAANFGFSTNKESFQRLVELLPFAKLKKSLQNSLGTEALIFGQSGFLEDGNEKYQLELNKEFQFLKQKYQLPDALSRAHWKFGKLRPANFPTVRLAQFSTLLHHHPQLFTLLVETSDIKALKKQLLVPMSNYWQTHYDFGKSRKRSSKTIGGSSFDNILINTAAPLLAAYAKFTDQQHYMDRAIGLLETIAPETNRITKKWDQLGIQSKSAFDSQALIQLYKCYCQKRRCLHCNIGVEILNQ